VELTTHPAPKPPLYQHLNGYDTFKQFIFKSVEMKVPWRMASPSKPSEAAMCSKEPLTTLQLSSYAPISDPFPETTRLLNTEESTQEGHFTNQDRSLTQGGSQT
jgi:hypothetical protein